ncbi:MULTISPECIES: GNAT family N-acetyltransferase [Nocardia]|uniref:GNAT family N-acetyltransferase n=1 Tax=Nocardia TaxID=1817 RepID=UPI0013004F99|nr:MULTISPECIES: GNAT family N-acetyltransferase [Nocardia]
MDLATVDIRHLDADDWATFRDIRLRALADAPYAFGSTLSTARHHTEPRWREMLATRTQFLATTDDVGIGTVGLVPEADESGLISMWVAPEARGTGVADLLVVTAVDHAVAAGHHRIRLDVTEGNRAAERLYHRHGFRRTGIRSTVAPDDPRTEFEMLLIL